MTEGFTGQADDMWTPYKELQKLIEINLVHDTQGPSSELELILRKYKQNFFNLLKNPPKNPKIRDELKKGVYENLPVRGIGQQVLSKELLNDVIIISDMYDLNERLALDLLCTAQIQMSYYPGLTRGLVAIILYYDGRKALVYSLKLLVQARTGVVWRLGISEAISRYVTEYTDNLLKNGVYQRILDLLKSLDLIKEIEMLQKNKALGNSKYQRQVLDLFEDIRQYLADIIYMWSAQSGLPREPTIQLIEFLRLLKVEQDAVGGVDNITLTLQMALLYAIDLSVLHIREDGEEVVKILPLINDNEYIENISTELLPEKNPWESVGLHSLALFAMGVCIASVRLLPKSQFYQNMVEREDYFIRTAVDLKLFSFLHNVFLKNENIFKDRFYYYRMHNLFSDFIVMLPGKVKELRMRADETARTLQIYAQEGLDPPSNIPRFFEELLMCLGKLYSNDTLKLNLMLEYWCPTEVPIGQYNQRFAPRSVALFKFVRLAGDMIPPSLFIPYLTMLTGLASSTQSSRYCFNLLKQNGSVHSNTLSWDHFFGSMSRYLINLRQETPPMTDTVYKHRNYTKGIATSEINGLHAVLTIIKTVTTYDDFSRIAICEHPVWSPIRVFLGLVGCAVPTSLKAALITTLAAFSKSPEIAAQMWTNLESSQILLTIPTTSSYQPRGIETDLEEVESRSGEYHVTRAMLELLDVLTDAGIPRTLGAGPRKPGFDPYLTYIINSIFLKFLSRAYKDPEEKWIVGKLCLKLLEKFLVQYKPSTYDVSVTEFNPPPGYHIMIQLNRKSELLDLILFILDEGTNVFDTYINYIGKKHLETATLYCLSILNLALSLQQTFYNVVSGQISNVLLVNLSKLLLGINPRSSKPDYVIKICKYVGYQEFIPYHALIATKILIKLTNQPPIHSQIMNILLSYTDNDLELRHGFVCCLDAEDDWKEMDKLNEDNGVVTLTKEHIIKLMKQCLSLSAPNLTHYLCGFDVNRDISKTVFQFPGVLKFPRTCFHSLCSIMNLVVNANRSLIKPSLIELAYNMLYLLCANQKTSLPVLKFLRQTNNFFKNHIQAIPCTEEFTTSEINQLSWLLKILAIEQKLISSSNQIFYLKHLTKLIVGFPIVIDRDTESTDDLDMMQTSVQNLAITRNNMLSKLIKVFDYSYEEVTTPHWEYFENNLLEQLILNCQHEQFPRTVDVKKLHQSLNEELNSLQGTAVASQRQLINVEIQKVLSFVIKVNKNRQRSAAIVKFTDAWRQLTQIVFVTLPTDVMTIEEEQIAIIELLETLLNKMLGYEALSEVAILASAVVLVLTQCLRKTHINSLKRKNVTPINTNDNKLISKNIIYTNTSSLKHILHNIVEWIIISNVSAQKLRANLYGSLLQFLLMINAGFESKRHYLRSSSFVPQLNKTDTDTNDDNIVFSANVLTSFGDKLLETICHDCIGGHDICKMLAMSSLNMLIKLNLQPNWTTFLSSKGYLKHLIDSILNSDRDLKLILESLPETLRPVYLYETKMSLIVRIATTRYGAELLLDARILPCLTRMEVFNDHPKIEQYNPELSQFTPSIHVRYQQILFPALHLCDAMLTSLGTDNAAAVAQVLGFLLSHLNIVEIILQQGSPLIATQFLQELAIVTGIFARTANNNLSAISEYTDISINDPSHIKRIQRLMLALLPRFILSENSIKDLYAGGVVTEQLESDRLKYFMNIASNLVLYAQGLTAGCDEDRKNIVMIFQPTLNDPVMSNSATGRYIYSHYTEHTPNIGILIQQLLQCVQHYHKEKVNLDILSTKVATIPNMNSIDLKEFVATPTKNYNIFIIREQAFDVVSQRLKSKQREIDFTLFIIELCLYLIWAHLNYYMMKSKPKSIDINVLESNSSSNEECTWKVTEEDVINLQQELVSIFNDSFTRQLVEITQGFSALDKGFVEGLLRRIKRLIRFLPNDGKH